MSNHIAWYTIWHLVQKNFDILHWNYRSHKSESVSPWLKRNGRVLTVRTISQKLVAKSFGNAAKAKSSKSSAIMRFTRTFSYQTNIWDLNLDQYGSKWIIKRIWEINWAPLNKKSIENVHSPMQRPYNSAHFKTMQLDS